MVVLHSSFSGKGVISLTLKVWVTLDAATTASKVFL